MSKFRAYINLMGAIWLAGLSVLNTLNMIGFESAVIMALFVIGHLIMVIGK